MEPKNRSLKLGLAAMGLLWTSAQSVDAQETAPQPLPLPSQAPSNVPSFAVLLLSSGRIIQGNVSEDTDGSTYSLLQKGGPIRFPKRDVVKKFASLTELYDYKVAQLPAGDPDERMKLAQWCLEQKLNGEARKLLAEILELNSDDIRAQRMIASIDATSQNKPDGRDPAVQTTGVEMIDSAPRELSPGALPKNRVGGRGTPRPVVFDLPAPIAFRRTNEFTQFIHPILQQSCASCHNEKYNGDFQLIPAQSRRQWTPDLVRANLDATLRLINREQPDQSDLLAYAANPHGPNSRPIFHGANDKNYRSLAAWVRLLKSTDTVSQAKYAPASSNTYRTQAAASAEQFGAERFPTPRPAADVTATPAQVPALPQSKIIDRTIEFEAVSPAVPPGTEFTVPPLPGGPRPSSPIRPVGNQSVQSLPMPGAADSPRQAPPISSASRPIAGVPPGNPPGAIPAPPPDDVIPPTKRSDKKKGKIDPALLENVLKSRRQQ